MPPPNTMRRAPGPRWVHSPSPPGEPAAAGCGSSGACGRGRSIRLYIEPPIATRERVSGSRHQCSFDNRWIPAKAGIHRCSPLTHDAAPDTSAAVVPPVISAQARMIVRTAPTGTPSSVIPAKAGIHKAWTEHGCRCSHDGRTAASVYCSRSARAVLRLPRDMAGGEDAWRTTSPNPPRRSSPP